MKIGIHSPFLDLPYSCGLKSYNTNLLLQLGRIDKLNQYFIFVIKKPNLKLPPNFRTVKLPNTPIFKKQLLLPILIKKYNLDVFHFLDPYGSILLKHPNIITTVQDLDLSVTYPLLGGNLINRISSEITRYFVFKNTKQFITISSTISTELKKFLKNRRRNIKVVYHGLGSDFKTLNTKRTNKYFLTMGDFAPRKNVFRTIKAYSLLPVGIKNKFPLVVVASTSFAGHKFEVYAKYLHVLKNIRVGVNVPKNKLVGLYNNALVFVFPSLYEGFGLPILEAMASGCPVITANYGAMKEISGGSAYLVNPRSVDGIKEGMLEFVSDISLRKRFIRLGLKRAKNFSWQKTANQTLAIYRSLAKNDG